MAEDKAPEVVIPDTEETEPEQVETDEEVELDQADTIVSDGDEGDEPVVLEGEPLDRRFDSPLRGVRKLHARAHRRELAPAEFELVDDAEAASEAQEAAEPDEADEE